MALPKAKIRVNSARDDGYNFTTMPSSLERQQLSIFQPNRLAQAVIRSTPKGFQARAELRERDGPILVKSQRLRGLPILVRELGWRKDRMAVRGLIRLVEMPPVKSRQRTPQ